MKNIYSAEQLKKFIEYKKQYADLDDNYSVNSSDDGLKANELILNKRKENKKRGKSSKKR